MRWKKIINKKSEKWWTAKQKGMVYFKMSEQTFDKLQKKTMQLDTNDLLNSFCDGSWSDGGIFVEYINAI